ncbi:MAG TPA: zf-HC2 domain-containing protein, partial [Dehalococcoidia bacterium]|nr:zf-HC2 domain-containing protein [Dehalococcoidia bacterium]
MGILYSLFHRRLRRRLPLLLDQRLLPGEQRRLEEHLAACQACRREIEELRAVREMLQRWPLAEAPRAFALEPVHHEAVRARGVPGPLLQRAMPLTAALAALFLAAVVSLDLAGQARGPVEPVA